jgi:hypothetical protein
MTVTNKRLLISESRGDSNRCTPCRGKPDQHTTYAFHASQCTLLAGSPRTWQPFTSYRQSWAGPLLPRKRAPDIIQRAGWLIHGFVPSCSPESTNKTVRAKPSIYWRSATRLTGPISPICDRYIQYLLTGPTHWSLTDIGGGYNLGGAGLPHTTPRPFLTSCLHFPPKGLARSPV